MTAQIIFPDKPTYWIISNGSSYIDGYTSPGNTTTFGAGTQIYWIGADYNEYITECQNVNLKPRNINNNRPNIPVVSLNNVESVLSEIDNLKQRLDNPIQLVDPAISAKINELEQKQQASTETISETIIELTSKQQDIVSTLDTINTVIPGQRISARQARLWLINNGVDLNNIDLAIDSIEDPIIRESVKVEWERAPYIDRNHEWLNSLASILGLSSDDLDRAFEEAPLL